jgi:hypothetical protein
MEDEKNLQALQRSRASKNSVQSEPMPVRVVRAPKQKPSKILLASIGVLAFFLVVQIFLQAVMLVKIDRKLSTIQDQLEELAPQESSASISLAGSVADISFMFNNAAPYDIELCDINGNLLESQTVSVKLINLSSETIQKISGKVNEASIKSLVSSMNAADEDYAYALQSENNKLTLIVSDKDSGEQVLSTSGTLAISANYLLGNAANTQNITLSKPVVLLINRASVLGLDNQVNIGLDLTLSLNNQELETSLSVGVSSVDFNTAASEYVTYADEILEIKS